MPLWDLLHGMVYRSVIHWLFVACLLAVVSGCGDDKKPVSTGDVVGRVVTADGAPITGVTIEAGKARAKTDGQGVFRFVDLAAPDRLELFVREPGYSTGHSRVQVDAGATVQAELALLDMQVLTLDDGALGGSVESPDGFSLFLHPGSLEDENGKIVRGPVQVSVALIDRHTRMNAAPGNMMSLRGDTEVPLESFGMAEVRFSQNGKTVHFAGKQARISFPVIGAFAEGDVLPLYSFNEVKKLWIESGTGSVHGGAFVADVSHFSWWNADAPLEDVSCVRGRIRVDGEDIAGALVQARGLDYMAQLSVNTDAEGRFCLPVGRGSSNRVSVSFTRYEDDVPVIYEWSGAVEAPEVAAQCSGTGCLDLGDLSLRRSAYSCISTVWDRQTAPAVLHWRASDASGPFAFGATRMVPGATSCLWLPSNATYDLWFVPFGDSLDRQGTVVCGDGPCPTPASRCTLSMLDSPPGQAQNPLSEMCDASCAGAFLTCTGGPPTQERCACGEELPGRFCLARSETCNGVDDDCDGVTDDNLTSSFACSDDGTDETPCEGVASTWCEDGARAGGDCEATSTPEMELCDGRDNDCNGAIDDLGGTPVEGCGSGPCRVAGQIQCTNGEWGDVSCTPDPTQATAETCDLIDNDCDGSIDDNLTGAPVDCGCGVTATQTCTDGVFAASCPPPQPAFDACDLIDNDCDGSIDEDQLCCSEPPVTVDPWEAQVPTITLLVEASANIASVWTELVTGIAAQIRLAEGRVRFGLAVYPAPGKGDCAPGELLMEPRLNNAAAIEARLRSITPAGRSPLAATFRDLSPVLAELPGPRATVVVGEGYLGCDPDNTAQNPADVGFYLARAYRQTQDLVFGIPTLAAAPSDGNDTAWAEIPANSQGWMTFINNDVPNTSERMAEVMRHLDPCQVRVRGVNDRSLGALSPSLNGAPLRTSIDFETSPRTLNEAPSILLRGEACTTWMNGGSLVLTNSCGVCGEYEWCDAEDTDCDEYQSGQRYATGTYRLDDRTTMSCPDATLASTVLASDSEVTTLQALPRVATMTDSLVLSQGDGGCVLRFVRANGQVTTQSTTGNCTPLDLIADSRNFYTLLRVGTDSRVIATSASNAPLWTRSWAFDGQALTTDPLGNLLLVGRSRSALRLGAVAIPANTAFIMVIDSTGTPTSANTLAGVNTPNDVAADGDGNTYVIGTTDDAAMPGTFVRLRPSFEVEWQIPMLVPADLLAAARDRAYLVWNAPAGGPDSADSCSDAQEGEYTLRGYYGSGLTIFSRDPVNYFSESGREREDEVRIESMAVDRQGNLVVAGSVRGATTSFDYLGQYYWPPTDGRPTAFIAAFDRNGGSFANDVMAQSWDTQQTADSRFGSVSIGTDGTIVGALRVGAGSLTLGPDTIANGATSDVYARFSLASCGACVPLESGYPGDGQTNCGPGLGGLTSSVGTVSPAVNPGTLAYRLDVPISVQSLTLTPTVSPGATVTIQGQELAQGQAWQSPTLDLGDNVVTLVVSAPGRPSATYTVTITRGTQEAYIKASNTDANDGFGARISLSGDTLVVGAPNEDSSARGVNAAGSLNDAANSGAAYVFVRDGKTWSQQAYLKASNTAAGDQFGWNVAVSGNTLVVGAKFEDSCADGVAGNQDDNACSGAGAAYVFVRRGGTWSQQAYLKASNSDPGDEFGHSVAIDGNTLVIGARYEQSSAQGVGGDQANNDSVSAGAVYVFARTGSNWSQQAYLKTSNQQSGDQFGEVVTISGNTIVVGVFAEDSAATGINGDQTNNDATWSGAAYVFVRGGTSWSQQAYLKASNTEADDRFGSSVSLSGDTLVVGAFRENSGATGVNGNQNNTAAPVSGAAYVFVRNGTNWSQQAYLKASNTGAQDRFGWAAALSGDTIVVGAHLEDSGARGVDGDGGNDAASSSGAAYVFRRTAGIWSQTAYLKASNADVNDEFGIFVDVDGDTIVVSAKEASNATGINGNEGDNSMAGAGAVYVFR